MAVSAYRQLLRSVRIAFEGDTSRLSAAHSEARRQFEQGRGLTSGSAEAQKRIEHAEAVAKVLRENVVQGVQSDAAQSRYKLRIHQYTERGDNDSIKQIGERNTLQGAKCSSFS